LSKREIVHFIDKSKEGLDQFQQKKNKECNLCI